MKESLRKDSWKVLAVMLLIIAVVPSVQGFPSGSSPVLENIPHFSNIFVIMLENKSFVETWNPANAPYLNSLRQQGVLLNQYYGIVHPSVGNYISNTSAEPPNTTPGDCFNYTQCFNLVNSTTYAHGRNLTDQLRQNNVSWKGYMDSMPAPCTHEPVGSTGERYVVGYADRHDPFIYYQTVISDTMDPNYCASHVVPYTDLATDLASNTVPQFAYITPDTCHDGHDNPCANNTPGGLPAADNWLKNNVPPILQYVQDHNGVLIITFDESEAGGPNADSTGCCGGGLNGGPGTGGRIGLLAISPYVTPATENNTKYDHAGLLRTFEDAFGISEHLNNANSANTTAMSDVFLAAPRATKTSTATVTSTATATANATATVTATTTLTATTTTLPTATGTVTPTTTPQEATPTTTTVPLIKVFFPFVERGGPVGGSG